VSKLSSSIQVKEKNIGIELLRIISMLMIVLLHVTRQTFDFWTADKSSVNMFLTLYINSCSMPSVNCFAMISGYVMLFSTVRYSRLIYLWFQVIFYSLGIWIFFHFFLKIDTHLFGIFFRPITRNCWWYISAYFGLFPFIPLINKSICAASDKELYKWLCAILFFFSLLPAIAHNRDVFGLLHGFSVVWLMCCYIIGASLRKILDNLKLDLLKKIQNAVPFLLIILLSAIAALTAIRCFTPIGSQPHLLLLYDSYLSPFIVIYSVLLLIFFSGIKVTTTYCKKTINFFSPLTFGVYLIHTHPLVWKRIFEDNVKIHISTQFLPVLLFKIFTYSLIIFFVCALFDYIRKNIFDWLGVESLCKKIISIVEKLSIFFIKSFINSFTKSSFGNNS